MRLYPNRNHLNNIEKINSLLKIAAPEKESLVISKDYSREKIENKLDIILDELLNKAVENEIIT